MLTNLNHKLYIKIFIFLSWMAMWVSINSMPGELLYMHENIITFINGTRTINAIIFSLFSIVVALYYFSKNDGKINYFSIVILIFLIHFVSQLIGLILNPERSFYDLNNIYLILYSLGTIAILYIIKNLNLNELVPYLMNFIFFILIFSIFFILFSNRELIPEILNQGNFYYLIHPDVSINYQAQPRITGFSRTVSIINIFFIVYYLVNHKKTYSFLYIIPILTFSIIIWLSQSRGTIICFYLSSIILIFFLNNLPLLKKIFIFSLITFFSIFSANTITSININSKNNQDLYKDLDNPPNQNLDKSLNDEIKTGKNNMTDTGKLKNILKLDESRFVTQKNTSGRTTLWNQAINYFDKRAIFGYGPQADRIVLFDKKNKYGNNVSNGSLYALLSGGYPSLISMILIYLYSINLFFKLFVKRKKNILNDKNKIYVISMTFCIFFMIRSLIENSFSLFSIDFLITILSLFVVERFKFSKNFK